MDDHGLLVACDVRPRRIRLLADAVRASGATCVRIVQVPRTDSLPFAARFDRVLVDAPCSSLGTVRRDPDVKWRRKPEDLAVFAGAQLELLRRAADVVRPGGRLVYATCSSEPEENEHVVSQFLAGRPEFTAIHLGADLPVSLLPLVDGQGHLRTLPHTHRLEAFFAAAMGRAPA